MTDNYSEFVQACVATKEQKELLKVLRAEAEQAGIKAKNETVGTMADKIAAIRTVWTPYNERIAQVETAIAQIQAKADAAWGAYDQERVQA